MNDNVRIYHVDEYCEGASHFNFRGERKDVVLLEDYEKLREENERLKVENKRLKAENIMLRSAGLKQSLEHEQIFKDFIKENAKLKCLSLHAMSEYFYLKAETYTDIEAGKYLKVMMLATKSYEAYRKAKAKMKEEK